MIVLPLQGAIVGASRGTLFVLLGAVGFVLLIACANVANLVLARATARQRETVVRAAVGGGRARLIRQVLTESALLAALAGAAGMLLARWGVTAVVALAPADLPRLDEVTVDRTALLFTLLRTAVPVAGQAQAPRATEFYRNILPELRALPGVIAAGAVTGLPSAVRSNGGYWIEGGPGPEVTGVRAPQAIFTVVTPDYFRAMRIPIVSGRDFTDADRRDAPFVAVVNEALVRESFPDRDPIGVTIRTGLDTPDPMTIVGIVRDVRTWGPSRPAQSEIYMPYEQHAGPATALNIVMRADGADPLALGNTAARLIRERTPDVPVRIDTMEGTLATATATPRFRTLLLIVFAVVALLLAIAGVYGVMAFTVSRRVPEIGVRVALGAAPRNVLGLVMREGAILTAAGVVLGVALARAGSRLISGFLFGVTPHDAGVVTGVAALVTVAALSACYLPGRRALRVDPVVALRAE